MEGSTSLLGTLDLLLENSIILLNDVPHGLLIGCIHVVFKLLILLSVPVVELVNLVLLCTDPLLSELLHGHFWSILATKTITVQGINVIIILEVVVIFNSLQNSLIGGEQLLEGSNLLGQGVIIITVA